MTFCQFRFSLERKKHCSNDAVIDSKKIVNFTGSTLDGATFPLAKVFNIKSKNSVLRIDHSFPASNLLGL